MSNRCLMQWYFTCCRPIRWCAELAEKFVSVPTVYASVVWSWTHWVGNTSCFAASELNQFCFCNKAFWYCHVQFVSLTGNQRLYLHGQAVCVLLDLHPILLIKQRTDISLRFLLGHCRREDINYHRLDLNL